MNSSEEEIRDIVFQEAYKKIVQEIIPHVLIEKEASREDFNEVYIAKIRLLRFEDQREFNELIHLLVKTLNFDQKTILKKILDIY
ncbi:MAG TPA: hypothetical protein ENH06_01625 [bacterium]|nr:hypothetical protein [bacterium]